MKNKKSEIPLTKENFCEMTPLRNRHKMRLHSGVISFFIFCILFSIPASAQNVRWEPASGSLAEGQVSTLTLVFENCEPEKQPVSLPSVGGLAFGQPSSSSESSFSFGSAQGNTSRKNLKLRYPVRPTGREEIVIPQFQIKTDDGVKTVSEARFTVGSATVSSGTVPLSSVAFSQFILPEKTIWAGEIFPLTYKLSLAASMQPRLSGEPEWDSSPLITEPFPAKYTVKNTLREGRDFAEVSYETRAMSTRDGAVSFAPLAQNVQLISGGSRSIFGPDYSQYTIRTTPVSLTVKPLPKPLPEDFTGAVGEFNFTSKAVPEKVAVGEPITWTVELSGAGNWPEINALPEREVSLDFQVVQPRAKKTEKPGTLFDAALAEDVILIPTKPGKYTFAPVKISVFDPKNGTYKTLKTPPVSVEVTEKNGTGATATFQNSATKNGTGAAQNLPQISPPDFPEEIPGDPLSNGISVRTPVSFFAVFCGAFFAGVSPIFIWLFLAFQRARLTDPLRPRRLAKIKLGKILGEISGAKDENDTARLLLEWQHNAAIFWRIENAAPSAREFSDARWAALWTDADRVLYRKETALSQEWISLAKTALEAAPLRHFSPFQIFLFRNLFPFFVMIFLAMTPVSFAQTTANDAYANADFKTAEKLWREQVENDPANFGARHNLSLALAQQERWAESAAQAMAAFVQKPDDAAVRRQTRLALGKGGFIPLPFVAFQNDTPAGNLAQQMTPASWQIAFIGGIAGIALGAMIALFRGYGLLGKWARWSAGFFAIGGAIFAGLSLLALHTFGDLKNARAAIVWRSTTLYSVPTEADETQQTTPVAAGSIVILENDFLGWRQVSFSNGQTGWLRAEGLCEIWESRRRGD